jgi:hypothetical protein
MAPPSFVTEFSKPPPMPPYNEPVMALYAPPAIFD